MFRIHQSFFPSVEQDMKRHLWYIFPALGLVILSFFAWMSRPQFAEPALSLRFTEQVSDGIHVNPFGQFSLTNLSGQALQWSRVAVEAPRDPDLFFSASLDSNIPRGELNKSASTNFRALVPHSKGVPFRVLVSYAPEPRAIDKLRARLPRIFPSVNLIWSGNPPISRVFTSQWFYATTDYKK